MFNIEITDHRITDLHDPRRVTRAGEETDMGAALDAAQSVAEGFARATGYRANLVNRCDGPCWIVQDVNGYGRRDIATVRVFVDAR